MPGRFQIELPKPCHENWEKMNPVEQGRFCNSCQKAVVDFTEMSDAQLVAFFRKPSTGSVCGRFYNDQVGRDLFVPRKRMPWLKYFLQLLVPTFLFACKARTQGAPRPMGETVWVETKKGVKDKDGNIKDQKPDSTRIRGRVTDQNGAGIPNASVVIKGSNRGVLTNFSGHYELDITALAPKQILVFSSVGFMDAELSVNNLQQKIDCVLQLFVMGEVVVTHPRKRKKERGSN